MAEKVYNRNEMSEVIRNGGAVVFKGRIIADVKDLPDITEMARTMSPAEAQALLAQKQQEDAENRRITAALEQIVAAANQGKTDANATTSTDTTGTDSSVPTSTPASGDDEDDDASTDGEGSVSNTGQETAGETGETNPSLTGDVSPTGTQSTARGRSSRSS